MRIDCKDLACPEPVLKTKTALEGLPDDAILEIELNSVSSIENCTRFGENQGCTVQKKALEDGTTLLTLVKGYGCAIVESEKEGLVNKTFFFKSDQIGEGELGKKLLFGFLKAALELDSLPKTIIFVNTGVKVTTLEENQPAIDSLLELEKRGVEVYSCGLCLGELGIDPSLVKVGKVGNAFDTMQTLVGSDVVSL